MSRLCLRVGDLVRAREPLPRSGRPRPHAGRPGRCILQMSAEADVERVLDTLSPDRVRIVADAFASGATPTVPGAGPAAQDAVAQLVWSAGGADVALALRVGLRARLEAAACAARPVW